ncbi:hypothetical protein [Candidatus Enterovibrio escicola]|uniref:hypothetical protein n=1 Tax=Candidatus Enterovibrio escicola TaxID=1927127 RepID=UPI0030DBB424
MTTIIGKMMMTMSEFSMDLRLSKFDNNLCEVTVMYSISFGLFHLLYYSSYN